MTCSSHKYGVTISVTSNGIHLSRSRVTLSFLLLTRTARVLLLNNMSSKRKWDQPAPEEGSTSAKPDDSKSATDAAAAAAAIAAKIAAQFAGGGLGGLGGMKDPHDGDFTKDIDINDVRNR